MLRTPEGMWDQSLYSLAREGVATTAADGQNRTVPGMTGGQGFVS